MLKEIIKNPVLVVLIVVSIVLSSALLRSDLRYENRASSFISDSMQCSVDHMDEQLSSGQAPHKVFEIYENSSHSVDGWAYSDEFSGADGVSLNLVFVSVNEGKILYGAVSDATFVNRRDVNNALGLSDSIETGFSFTLKDLEKLTVGEYKINLIGWVAGKLLFCESGLVNVSSGSG